MEQRFKSKVDWWLGLILFILPVALVTAAIGLLASGKITESAMGGGLVLFLVLLYGGLLFPLYYQLEEDVLLVRAGLLRSRFPYAQITSVEPSNNMLSSPALSLDRLHVHVEGKFGALISPKEKAEFLDALAKKCPHLTRKGDALLKE